MLQSVNSFILFNNFFGINNINEKIVNDIATTLPNIDSIGHQVVLLNKDLVNVLLHNDKLPIEIKKDIILLFIKLSQEGDKFGSIVLSNYYHLANYFL